MYYYSSEIKQLLTTARRILSLMRVIRRWLGGWFNNYYWQIVSRTYIFQMEYNGIINPTGRRQLVGYLQAWLRFWTQDNREKIQQMVSQIVSSTCWPLCHFAFWELSLNRNLRCSCYVYWVTVCGNSIVCNWMYCDLVQYIIQLILQTEWSVICRPLHL